MRVLVLGVSGMLGSTAFRLLDQEPGLTAYGTARSGDVRAWFPRAGERILTGVEVDNIDQLAAALGKVRPDIVVNCIGVVKQIASASDPLTIIPMNALLPHRLAQLCALGRARFIHISTDCVFSGRDGNYTEASIPDAEDLYGRSKLLGEVDYPNAVTLRTSIIGHELASKNGLLEWFLAAHGTVSGYARAIFSGLTTDELARVIIRQILPRPDLHGVYHVSVDAIAKFDLLQLFKSVYGLDTRIERNESFVIDRSLNSERFRAATGYRPPSWPELVATMRDVGRLARAS